MVDCEKIKGKNIIIVSIVLTIIIFSFLLFGISTI